MKGRLVIGPGLMIAIILIVSGLWMPAAPPTYGSAETGRLMVSVSVAPERVSTSVGTEVEVTVTLANQAAEPTPELAVHLDITDPRRSESVDPEDWTAELTRSVPPVEPGESVAVSWAITPIQPGEFALYAVALDANAGAEPGPLAVSNGVPVRVDERRNFNPQGILPLAIAMPVVIGMVLLWRYRRLRLA